MTVNLMVTTVDDRRPMLTYPDADLWWAEFDEAIAGSDVVPNDEEFVIALHARRAGLSPTGAAVSILRQRELENT